MEYSFLHKLPPTSGLVDLYCERTLDGLFAEPWNLFSNVVFFIVFFVIRKRLAAENITSRLFQSLNFLILAIAIGSTLFHSFARFWALVLDVGPISIFMLLYVITYLVCILRLDTRRVIVISVLFVLFTASLRVIKVEGLNNSEFYFSPLLAILLMFIDRYRRHDVSAKMYGFTLISFSAALFCRIMDAQICAIFPIGTHFLWHVFNGACVYFCMKAIILARQSRLVSS